MHRITETLDGSFIRESVLDISKAQTRCSIGNCYSTLSLSYFWKFTWLSNLFPQVVVNEADNINACITQCSLLLPTLFLPFIYDLPKNILWLLININADDTTVYGCTSNKQKSFLWPCSNSSSVTFNKNQTGIILSSLITSWVFFSDNEWLYS